MNNDRVQVLLDVIGQLLTEAAALDLQEPQEGVDAAETARRQACADRVGAFQQQLARLEREVLDDYA